MGRDSRLALTVALFVFAWLVPVSASSQEVTLRIAANGRRIARGTSASSAWPPRSTAIERESARRIPPTAHVSTESDIIQRMRFGLDGALLTTYGLAEQYPDILALSMPTFIGNEKEFNAVLAAVVPMVKAKLADRYVVLGITKEGASGSGTFPVAHRLPSRPGQAPDIARPEPGKGDNADGERRRSRGRGHGGGFSAGQLNADAVDATCVSPIYAATLWSQLREQDRVHVVLQGRAVHRGIGSQ